MPTIAQQLSQLEQDREDLVDNLETKGITGLTGDETFTELVPEVLNISGGGGTGPLPTNLRHIQVGDNLYNKKLYFTFPSNINELISQYHLSFGDSGITIRNFISTVLLTNPIDFTSFPNGDFALSTYNTTNYATWGSVQINYGNRNYFFVCSNTSSTYSYLGIDLSKDNRCNVNKQIVYIDTNNPAYQYVWVEDEPEPQLRNIEVGDVLYGKHLYYDISSSDLEQLNDTPTIIETQPNPNDYNNTGQLSYSGGQYNFVSISKDNGDIDRLYSNYAAYEESPYEVIGTNWQMPVATITANDPIYQKIYVDANEIGD